MVDSHWFLAVFLLSVLGDMPLVYLKRLKATNAFVATLQGCLDQTSFQVCEQKTLTEGLHKGFRSKAL